MESSNPKKPVVAVFNSSEDIVELFRTLLEDAGFNTVAAHVPSIERGEIDLIRFTEEHDPAVIVYDIPPPYQQSWNILKQMRDLKVMQGRQFVFTTTNKARLQAIAKGEIEAFEIAEKPVDFEVVVDAVRRAVKS